MKTKIMKMGINGEGIAYIGGKPVFVPNALIDEIVDIRITETNPTYKRAEVVEVLKKSKHRVQPKCKLYDHCGGCSLMNLTVAKQCVYKKDLMIETLIKYANIDTSIVEDVIKSPDYLHYRNQLKWPVKMIKGRLYAGMYREGSNHLVTIDNCIVHDHKLESTKNKVMKVLNNHKQRDYYSKIEKGIRYIVLRGFDKFQLTIVSGKNSFDKRMIEDLMKIEGMQSVNQCINTSKDNHQIFSNQMINLAGSKTIETEINGLKLRLAPKSFFQLNKKQAANLYRQAIDLFTPAKLMVEAYCGVGTMSLLALEKMDEVIGIEYISDAIKNAKNNAKINRLENRASFITGDSATKLDEILADRKVDALLVDPPRTGLDDNMLESIINSDIDEIVYISCNVATLAKNLDVLKHYYKVERIIPFDMFTHTAHVESVTLLRRK